MIEKHVPGSRTLHHIAGKNVAVNAARRVSADPLGFSFRVLCEDSRDEMQQRDSRRVPGGYDRIYSDHSSRRNQEKQLSGSWQERQWNVHELQEVDADGGRATRSVRTHAWPSKVRGRVTPQQPIVLTWGVLTRSRYEWFFSTILVTVTFASV